MSPPKRRHLMGPRNQSEIEKSAIIQPMSNEVIEKGVIASMAGTTHGRICMVQVVVSRADATCLRVKVPQLR